MFLKNTKIHYLSGGSDQFVADEFTDVVANYTGLLEIDMIEEW